jgi:phosphomethylpyrimidine synthase
MTGLAKLTDELADTIKTIAKKEGVEEAKLARSFSAGRVVIPSNPAHDPAPMGIGDVLRVKVNTNIGTSPDHINLDEELEKVKVALEYKTDAVMDLSIGGDLDDIRRSILKETPVAFGTVPVYQAGIEALQHGKLVEMTEDDIFSTIEKHAKDGVDYIVAHCGITKQSVERLKNQNRLINMVSRGGSFHASWIIYNEAENPLYQNYDYLLEIAREHNLILSLGDGMRSGCIHDANDRAKFQELLILGELVERARAAGVQAMVEGPGHVPLQMIRSNIEVMKTVTDGAPYFVLGPLVTDIAPGYDHIVGAIGGAIAGYAGADFLCYVTPSEHLRLPDVEDVKEGVIAARIAGHAADIARGNPVAYNKDHEMSRARRDLDWSKQFELVIDPEKSRRYRTERKPDDEEFCSMCGDFCAIKRVREL